LEVDKLYSTPNCGTSARLHILHNARYKLLSFVE
jgi:hypothetical protein